MAIDDCPSSTTGRLFVTDRTSKMQFAVDTGSNLCVFLRSAVRDRRLRTRYNQCAANGLTIVTYGCINLNLYTGLRRNVIWGFAVTDVTNPIIGVDFVNFYNLVVHIRSKCLVDNSTLI